MLSISTHVEYILVVVVLGFNASVVSPPNQCSWLSNQFISSQATDYFLTDAEVTDKWHVDILSEISYQAEMLPARIWIEPGNPRINNPKIYSLS